ncbi:hypothetical protein [Francisella sp. SYW-9]|uniref:hypothetical protein n=1 Tax=Francisella sp. SYW-9 TaxID=2610888 RepID=UPI00123CE569|nr:hypothetical protein [Francisella sp. SYW-9]
MNSGLAEDSNTGEIIHGSILYSLDNEYIIKTVFVCPSNKCKKIATPCAYDNTKSPPYKKTSYFRYDSKHTTECDLYHSSNVISGDSIDPSTIVESGLYISKLNLNPNPVETIINDGVDKNLNNPRKSNSSSQGNPTKTQQNQKSTSSIKPLVDLYINAPNLYEDLPLQITGLGERSYKNTFQLVFNRDNLEYTKKSIFYGAINTMKEISEVNGIYTVNLVAKPYKLKIDTSNWSETHKRIFLKEFEENFKDAKKYFITHNKNIKKQMYIFFFGDFDNENKLFSTNNFKLIYFVFMDRFKLPISEGNYIYKNDVPQDSSLDIEDVIIEPIQLPSESKPEKDANIVEELTPKVEASFEEKKEVIKNETVDSENEYINKKEQVFLDKSEVKRLSIFSKILNFFRK